MSTSSEALLCPCQFQLVLRYNPEPGALFGRDIEPEVLASIFRDLNMTFGNWTPLGTAGQSGLPDGQWEGQAEPSVRIEVAVPQDRVEEVEKFVIEVGKRLKQKAMYFVAGPPSAKIIEIEEEPGRAAKRGK